MVVTDSRSLVDLLDKITAATLAADGAGLHAVAALLAHAYEAADTALSDTR